MNSKILTYLFVIITASTVACWPGTHSLSSSSCDGGAASCAGGKFRLSGAAGQPDAGAATGGTFVQQGGFIPALQKPAGPSMTVTPSGSALLVIWSDNACNGFRLEGSAAVDGSPWVDLGEGLVYGPDRLVAVSMSSGYGFFRLTKACAGGCPQTCPP